MKSSECRLLSFPKVVDGRGHLAIIEGSADVPFRIERVFYVYDIPKGARRGGHAHRKLEEVIVCLSGGLEVEVNDGRESRAFRLDSPDVGLYVPPMIWIDTQNFEDGTVFMVLASDHYVESDYVRSYEEFVMNGGKESE